MFISAEMEKVNNSLKLNAIWTPGMGKNFGQHTLRVNTAQEAVHYFKKQLTGFNFNSMYLKIKNSGVLILFVADMFRS